MWDHVGHLLAGMENVLEKGGLEGLLVEYMDLLIVVSVYLGD